MQAMFIIGACLVIAGLSNGSTRLRQAGAPIATLSLIIMVILRRGLWLSWSYALSAVMAVVLFLLSDLIVLEPIQTNLHPLAFLLLCVGNLCATSAMWSPTVQASSVEHPSVDLAWSAPSHLSARVPLHALRAVPSCIMLLAVILYGRINGISSSAEALIDHSSIFAAAVCFIVCQALLLWRAFARVGYRSPTIALALSLVRANRQSPPAAPLPGQRAAGASRGAMAPPRSGGSMLRGHRRDSSSRFTDMLSKSTDAAGGQRRAGMSRAESWYGGGGGGGGSVLSGGGSSSWASAGDAGIPLMKEDAARRVFQAYGHSESLESRARQWLGVLAVLLLLASQLAASLAVFWGVGQDGQYDLSADGPAIAVYVYATTNWLGQVALLFSVPQVLPPMGSVNDPYVRPAACSGTTKNVLFILPAGAYDATSTAIAWSFLTHRGHTVRFASPGGRAPAADTSSITGVGPGGEWLRPGSGPIVLAQHQDMESSEAFQRPWALDSVDPSLFQGVFVADGAKGPSYCGDAFERRPEVLACIVHALAQGSAVLATLGRGTIPVAAALRSVPAPHPSQASGPRGTGQGYQRPSARSVAPLRIAVQPLWLEAALDCTLALCACRWGRSAACCARVAMPPPLPRAERSPDGAHDRSCWLCRSSVRSQVQRLAREGGAKVLEGPYTGIAPGSAWDDSGAFVVESEVAVTGRWRGDAWLLARRFAALLESPEVGRGASRSIGQAVTVEHSELSLRMSSGGSVGGWGGGGVGSPSGGLDTSGMSLPRMHS